MRQPPTSISDGLQWDRRARHGFTANVVKQLAHGVQFAWIEVACAAILVLAGGFLRLFKIGAMQVFADELHTLKWAAENSYGRIASHIAPSDACIPYTLYNKLLMDTTGLAEWNMRLPAAVAGILLLPLCYLAMKKICGPVAALLGLGILSFSPYLVYLSRQARPYSMTMLLITLAAAAILSWRYHHRFALIIIAGFALALSIYFHPVTIPTAGLIWLYPLVAMRLRNNAPPWKDYLIASLVTALTVIVLMGPVLPSLLTSVAVKTARGYANGDVAANGLLLIHALPVRLPAWMWALLSAIGFISLFRRYRMEAAALLIMVLVQLLVIQTIKPHLVEIPWVWIRYLIHLFPLLLIGFLAGLGPWLSRWQKTMRPGLALTVICLVLYGAYHIQAARYPLSGDQNYADHPMIMMLPNERAELEKICPAAGFYVNQLAAYESGVQVVESPRLYVFPLYELYGRLHGRRIFTAGITAGLGQTLLEDYPGFRFKTVWRPSFSSSGDRTIWIHHKNIQQEIAAACKEANRNTFVAGQLEALCAYMLTPEVGDMLFGSGAQLRSFQPEHGRLIYEDPWLSVFVIQ